MTRRKLVLVTGATGYVGGCLVPHLLEMGYLVRVLVRDQARLLSRTWLSQVEVVDGNILSLDVLQKALQGVSTAYYLVHNMISGRGYFNREIESAHNFASAAGSAGVEHVIYLGGLADPGENIGSHLRSRIHTGDILRSGTVPVTEFRASMIIGSGSISFEMIRYLTEQFPILVGPLWIRNRTQPIAIQNVLEYLLSALEGQTHRGRIYEIGGKDILTYAEIMTVYARLRGLKRRVIALPVMPVNLVASFAGLLTPVTARIAGPLLGGMRSDTVVCDNAAERDFPHIHPLNYKTSVSVALDHLTPDCMEPIWEKGDSWFRINKEGFFIEGQQTRFRAKSEAVYRAITGLGGKRGWYYLNWLWKIRGFLDTLVGGPGLRDRRENGALVEGDILGFYRVEILEPVRRIRLKAELNAPGLGWMEWRISELADGDVLLTQIAFFAPHGLLGFLYWYILLPFHHLVFKGLMAAIVRQANETQQML